MQKQLIIIAAGFLISYPSAIFSDSINLSSNTSEDKINNNVDKANSNNKIKDGDIKYKNEDYRGAIIDYSEILKNNPENKHAFFRRALSKSKIKDYEGAISDLSLIHI